MINVGNYLHNDNKSKEELLDNIEIGKIVPSDLFDVLAIMKSSFEIKSIIEVIKQLSYSKALLYESIKLYDKRDNKIYGILIFSEYGIDKGSPMMHYSSNYELLTSYLSTFKQINGFAFIIDARLRGTNLDKKMLKYNIEYLNKYELIWIAVEKSLKTHNYWKRLGFIEVCDIPQATFYVLKTNEKPMDDIFILKKAADNEDYSLREWGKEIVRTIS